MAQMPKYMVVMPPGAPIPGVGFVRPGEVFTAPSADFVPSRTFRGVNEEGAKVLEAIHGKLVAAAEKRLQEAKPEAKEQAAGLVAEAKAARDRAAAVLDLPKPEAKVEDGLTLKQLGQVNAAPAKADGKSADRKL